jgi:hypothetical protein
LDVFGYLAYAVGVLLPGLGEALLLGLVRRERCLSEVAAYAVGLGLATDTAVMFVGSSGLRLGGVRFAGVGMADFYALLLIGLAAIFASLVMNGWPSLPRVSRIDLAVLALMLLQAGMLFAFFSKYPIFPAYESADYLIHVGITNTLLAGGTSIPGGLLYYGVHYQLSLGVLLTGGPTLIVVQRIVAILAVLGTPLVFLACERLFRGHVTALLACVIYALAGTSWFSGLFASGLYPNFFGVLACLFFLACFIDALDAPGFPTWIPLVLSTVMLYLSHYSSVAVLTAAVLAPATLLASKKLKHSHLVSVVLVLAPGAAGLALYPKLVPLLLQFVANPGGTVVGGTTLSGWLSFWPFLSGLAFETSYDIGFVILLVLTALGVVAGVREWRTFATVPVVWFASLMLLAPLNSGAWRFSYVALVPMTLLAARGLALVLLRAPRPKSRRRPFPWRKVAVVVLLTVLVAGSWGATELGDSITYTAISANAQVNVYDAMTWIASNLPKRASLLSVSDWRFDYTPLVAGHPETYHFFSTPDSAVSFAQSQRISYIVVTEVVTASLPPIASFLPWNNFPAASTQNLTLVYSNPDVRIFQIAA